MCSSGNALVHLSEPCRRAHQVKMAQEAAAERAEDSELAAFYGVFTLEPGRSGVYSDWADVERVLGGEELARSNLVSHNAFDSYEEADAFVKARTLAVATHDLEPDGAAEPTKTTKEALLAEKLAASRIGRVQACIDGRCDAEKNPANATKCRGGCGRSLHVASCAQLGRGYAALGNFTCVECRLLRIMEDPDEASEKVRLPVRTCR